MRGEKGFRPADHRAVSRICQPIRTQPSPASAIVLYTMHDGATALRSSLCCWSSVDCCCVQEALCCSCMRFEMNELL